MIAGIRHNPLLLMVVASAVALAVAFGSQYIGKLAPCELCWWQRYPYMAICVLGLLTVFSHDTKKTITLLCILLLITELGIAIFHVGVKQKWWIWESSCSGTTGVIDKLDDLLEQLKGTPVVRCDEAQWSLLGISMAGYNAIYALMVLILASRKGV